MDHRAALEPLGVRFREAFGRYPTGVAVICAAGPQGPVGLTASSVASVSLTPPALSFSVMGTRSARHLLTMPTLVVNLLGSAHLEVARGFSRPGGPRFTLDQGWSTLPTGEPFLPGALAALRVQPLRQVPIGDATVVVAGVLDVHHGPEDGQLIYHARQFHTSPLSPEAS
ncbi:flavin reductase family protein [Catellatospora bangladeshensis]|uniref:flavin reductase family protein n=1 Tax=Catellatospora bangladeshensis TaxID=310355 RepID=UPI00194249B6|nr:flavin reductase family protein [Catellatospora bangladeshensis]